MLVWIFGCDCLRVLISSRGLPAPLGPCNRLMPLTSLSPLRLCCYNLRALSFFSMGTVVGGPMIGNNRSTSIPTGGETKFHEHQTMVPWTGCRVESLVGFDHRCLCFERFSFMLGSYPFLRFCCAMGLFSHLVTKEKVNMVCHWRIMS